MKLPLLPPGLRLLQLPSTSQVAYCGIAVHAGTRNEAPGEHGLAHFCEHLAFKGTSRRSARKIINDIEGVGGELNAFTNKEDTVYYCVVQHQYLQRAIDVLCDIVFNSQYPQHEVEKEREVVCDEIESYEDSPSELIYDEFENLLFPNHPLGHNILGNSQQVRSYTSDDARRFTQQWYRPENCVLFVSGSERGVKRSEGGVKGSEKGVKGSEKGVKGSEWEVKGTIDQQREVLSPSLPLHSPFTPPSLPLHSSFTPLSLPLNTSLPPITIRERGTHQAHVMLGTRAFAANDDRRWALYLLNNILGGPSMNSRLNLTLRERHGLVYTVDSSMTCYSDTGLWAVYFGCDPHDVDRCCRLVRRELDRFTQQLLSPTVLRQAKRQLQGQLAIACENREQFTIDSARTFLHTGKGRSLNDIMAHIDRLTPDDLLNVAQLLFTPERITTLIYH
ncbi:MAG: insulinase family protein [Prevotella sp.]|nr:insulinase family protein [Prevotella sp.]